MKEQNQFLINIILTALLALTIWCMHQDNKTLYIIFNNKLAQGDTK